MWLWRRSRLKGVVLVDLQEEVTAVVEEVGGLGSLFIMEVATVFMEWDTMLVLEEVIMEVADLVELDLEGMVGWEGQGISSSMELCQEWDTLLEDLDMEVVVEGEVEFMELLEVRIMGLGDLVMVGAWVAMVELMVEALEDL